jgi:hypothetical protein
VECDSDSDSDFDSDDDSPPELERRRGDDDSSCSSKESESSSEDEDDDDFFNSIERIDRDEVYNILMESKSYETGSNPIGSTAEVETVQEEAPEDHDEGPAERAGVAVSDTDSLDPYENGRSTRELKEPTRFDRY